MPPIARYSPLFFAFALAAATTGCQSTTYRAATLPDELRAAPVSAQSHQIHLPNLAAASSAGMSQINPGDLIDVRIVSGAEETPSEPMALQVSQDGAVDVPYVGQIRVSGLEPVDASRAIANAAIQRGVYRQPSTSVEIRERATRKVTVLGAVTEPGVHNLPIGASDVLSAIAAAGGLTEEAGTNVEVLRQSPPTFMAGDPAAASPDGLQQVAYQTTPEEPSMERIDLAMAHKTPSRLRTLGDRDVVMVPPKQKRVIHVTGLVQKPDQFELPDDQNIRVLDAIAMAGGRSSPVADKVYVIRQANENAEPAVIEVSIASAKKNGRENLVLDQGDLVTVETTVATTVVDTVKDFLRITLGVGNAAFGL